MMTWSSSSPRGERPADGVDAFAPIMWAPDELALDTRALHEALRRDEAPEAEHLSERFRLLAWVMAGLLAQARRFAPSGNVPLSLNSRKTRKNSEDLAALLVAALRAFECPRLDSS